MVRNLPKECAMSRSPEPQRWWTVPGPGAHAFPSGDELFAHLDGRFVRVGSTGWRIEIYSVWAEEMRWVQLALRGPSEHMLVLRVPLAANAAEILSEIELWIRNPASADSVCSAAPCGISGPAPAFH
jgi:hypothetical protein